MQLTEILDLSCVVVPMKAQEKGEAISELIDTLDQQGKLTNPEIAKRAVMEREAIRSTGIGQGFAIPHGKCSAVKKLVMAVGRLENEIDFNSIDKQPVKIVVLLVSPIDQTGPHIQALARISRIMTNPEIREKLWGCPDAKEFFESITVEQG